MSVRADVVVIGAGFAGAATAYHLVQAGIRDVLLLEQEALPGSHASGLNAGMAWQATVSGPLLPLAIEGTRFIRQGFEDDEPVGLLHCGAIVLGVGDDCSELRAGVARLRGAGLSASWLEPRDVWERAPHARGPACEGGLYCGDDGVVDIAALLAGFIRAATAGGARLATERQVSGIRRRPGGLWTVETRTESVETPTIVNAAGAWAGEIGRLAGASSPPLRPCRRHLAVSGPLPWVERGWPIVWDESKGLYFRPEPPGLLLSACDVTPSRPARGPVPTDPAVLETLASKLQGHAPRMAQLEIAHHWAGLRTLTPDDLFVIGPDPQVEGFVWCAGLGGLGMTTSSAVGRLTAEAVQGAPVLPAFDPGRFG